jgi:hypothetical protein
VGSAARIYCRTKVPNALSICWCLRLSVCRFAVWENVGMESQSLTQGRAQEGGLSPLGETGGRPLGLPRGDGASATLGARNGWSGTFSAAQQDRVL